MMCGGRSGFTRSVTGFATPSLTFCNSLRPSNVPVGVANLNRLCSSQPGWSASVIRGNGATITPRNWRQRSKPVAAPPASITRGKLASPFPPPSPRCPAKRRLPRPSDAVPPPDIPANYPSPLDGRIPAALRGPGIGAMPLSSGNAACAAGPAAPVGPVCQRPYLVRGDCGFGNDLGLCGLEARDQGYLFKLRLTAKVKRHIERCFFGGTWVDAGAGWEGMDGRLRLTGWDRERRVVILRRPLQDEVALTGQADGQQVLAFIEDGDAVKRYEYAVLVTSLPHEILTVAQLYRDRGDAENSFDELKNQWGWGGFTTQDLHRCQLTARAVALGYNG